MNANFKIFHPHNSEVVEMAFEICDKKVEIIDNSEFIIKVLEEINHIQEINEPDMVVLLPDGGAYKWGVKLCDKINFSGDVIAAAKNRKFIDGTSILTQQLPDYDFEGKDVLIIDDSCIYGGTFTGLSSMLREQGCNKLYLAVSHITVQNHEKYNVFQYFDKVFTTNSKYNMYYERIDGNSGAEIKNLEIIKMF
jgi:phosphoribosylpyrophosphate synthetase